MSISTLANGFPGVAGLAIDKSDNIYEGDYNSNTITKITKYGQKTLFASGFTGLQNIAFDAVGFPNGYLYVLDNVTIYKVDKNGTKTGFLSLNPAIQAQNIHYLGFAIDKNNNVYYTNVQNMGVYKITPSLTVTKFIDGTSNMSYPLGITIDPSGNFFIMDYQRTNLFKYDSSGNLINSAFITAPAGQGWYNIIFDNSNNIYGTYGPTAANLTGQYLNKYTSTGTLISTIYTDPLGGIYPMVVDSQNNLYFTFSDPAALNPTTSYYDTTAILKYGSPSIVLSNTCFLAGTHITTNQGPVPIEQLRPGFHTIRNKHIVTITETITKDTYLVCFEKDSIAPNVPSFRTVITKNHKIWYQGKMIKACDCESGYQIPYHGETLYNVLLDDYEKMMVNNMICETLDPANPIAKLYLALPSMSQEQRDYVINYSNECVKQNKFLRIDPIST